MVYFLCRSDILAWVSKSVLSPWKCLMESEALLSPSQSEPGLVNGGFMITRSWLNGEMSTSSSERVSPVPVTAVAVCIGISDLNFPLSPSRSSEPMDTPPCSVFPY